MPGENEPEANASTPIWRTVGTLAVQMLVIQAAVRYFTGGKPVVPGADTTAKDGAAAPAAGVTGTTTAAVPTAAIPTAASGGTVPPAKAKLDCVNLYEPGSNFDILIKLSTDPAGNVDFGDATLPAVEWKDVNYNHTTNWEYVWETEWAVPESVQHNASIWADVFVTPAGVSPDPHSTAYSKEDVLHVRKMLTRYLPYKKPREVKSLLGGDEAGGDEAKDEEESEVEGDGDNNSTLSPTPTLGPIIAHYHPNLTLTLVYVDGPLAYSTLPPRFQDEIILADSRRTPLGQALHYPIVAANDFWLLREHIQPINTTTTVLPLRVAFGPTSWFKYQMYTSLHDGFAAQAEQGGGEMDEFKRVLIETQPLLLITTFLVSLLHMLFETLAFTSDISHWRGRKELVGVSVRTILTNCFVQLIVMLYLMDNNENTSWMILFSQGTGLLVEAWKITKAVDIDIVRETDPMRVLPFRLVITDKHVLSEDELKTQQYDQLAFRYVTYGTVPCLVAYTLYSLWYEKHRNWYSFVITTLTSFVYAFGFVQLIPQLIINYKLKSVAHIPMKTMMYKFLNTIVDDFFSFVVRMPILHRLACFRDDVVFVVLLYQMWIYKVDPTRANEYGQMMTEEEIARLEKEAAAAKEGHAIEATGTKDGEKEEEESRKDR